MLNVFRSLLFFAALSSLLSCPALAAITVKKGDTLYRISQRTGVSVARLRAINQLKNNLIAPGQVLKIGKTAVKAVPASIRPATSKSAAAKSSSKPATSKTSAVTQKTAAVRKAAPALKPAPKKVTTRPVAAAKSQRYTVKAGDTLGKLALRGKISMAALQQANHLSGTLIRVGQVLTLPPPGTKVVKVPALPPHTEARTFYTYTTVGPRDTFVTLSRVALRNGQLSAAQFMTLNKLSAPWLYPGQKVLLPRRVPVPIPPAPQRPAATLSATRVLGIPVQVVRVDLRHRDVLVSPVLPPDGLGSSARVNVLARVSGAAAVINGSYFHPRSFIPAGDLVMQGKRLTWGRIPAALSITPDNRARIGGGGGLSSTWAGMETVIASGPQIVSGGAVQRGAQYSSVFQDPAVFGRAARSAVGLIGERDLILVSTHTRLTTTEMGKIMARLGARDALLLDGGSSTGLSWNNAPILQSVRGVSYGIGVFPDYEGRRYSRS